MDDEDRAKLFAAVDEEITRICSGDTEYLRWLGKAAALVASTVAACRKLMDLAEKQGRPFEDRAKVQLAFLEWYGSMVTGIASQIETLGLLIDAPTAEILPFALLEPLVWMYGSAHRVAYALWRDRDETRLLWKDIPTTIN